MTRRRSPHIPRRPNGRLHSGVCPQAQLEDLLSSCVRNGQLRSNPVRVLQRRIEGGLRCVPYFFRRTMVIF